MKHFLILLLILFISCKPNQDKPPFLGDEKSYEIFKEIRIADLALESYDPVIRDSMRTVFLNEVSKSQGISISEIERTLIEIQSFPSLNKRFIDNFYNEIDTIIKKQSRSNTSDEKN